MEIDKHSKIWRTIEEWATGELDQLTKALIAKDNEQNRGAILKLQQLLNLPEHKRAPEGAAVEGEHHEGSY